MKRWERLEDYLFEFDLSGNSFSTKEYAETGGLSGGDASRDVQSYLVAQRAKRPRTLFVLKRETGTRTRTARWSVGQRAADIRVISMSFGDDVKRKFKRATQPDILRIAMVNPRAAKRAETVVEAIADGALKVLDAAVLGWEGDA